MLIRSSSSAPSVAAGALGDRRRPRHRSGAGGTNSCKAATWRPSSSSSDRDNTTRKQQPPVPRAVDFTNQLSRPVRTPHHHLSLLPSIQLGGARSNRDNKHSRGVPASIPARSHTGAGQAPARASCTARRPLRRHPRLSARPAASRTASPTPIDPPRRPRKEPASYSSTYSRVRVACRQFPGGPSRAQDVGGGTELVRSGSGASGIRKSLRSHATTGCAVPSP